jgi:RNA 2',3'-cyclic 3'-phosphodiesterase
MKRLFIAIKALPDPAFVARFRMLRAALPPRSIKWVEEHNIHITLKFLGETEENKIPGINRVLASVAGRQPAFELSLSGTGIFGSAYNPKVIWAGIQPYETLVSLMKTVHEEMEPVGFPRDRQNLVPHLTLGRIKFVEDKGRFQNVISLYKNLTSEPWKVEAILLIESILKKEGPEYHVLQAHSLQ